MFHLSLCTICGFIFLATAESTQHSVLVLRLYVFDSILRDVHTLHILIQSRSFLRTCSQLLELLECLVELVVLACALPIHVFRLILLESFQIDLCVCKAIVLDHMRLQVVEQTCCFGWPFVVLEARIGLSLSPIS